MNTTATHELALQLIASAVDARTGTIRGVTVAQAGVEATGKYILLDADGNLTRDPAIARRRLQVVTDAKTLETLMVAANAAGGSSKSREDHDESLGARIGYADNFKLEGNRVVCDLHVFDSYRNRNLLLETAAKTPKEIGISIDMTPRWEIENGRALMRIEELMAVDVVDEGAITHDGLFLNRGQGGGTVTHARTYLQLVADKVAASNGKLRRSDAHGAVMKANPEAYHEHLKRIGVAR